MKETIKQITRYREIKALYQKYERALIPGMLIFGLVVDFITFRSISIRNAFILLSLHFIVAGATIAFVNFYDYRRLENRGGYLRYLRLGAPLIIQFTFGAMLSASLIFYWFSGVFSVSWPFIALIALLIVSNDVFREYYLKPVVQIGVYYFIVFSLFTVIVPYILNSISVGTFILSGVLSLVAITVYIGVLAKTFQHIHLKRQTLAIVVASVFIFMNTMYFLNVIPPIPLSLREAGVYHDIEREPGQYTVLSEAESVLQKILPGQVIHIIEGDEVYVFTQIFAPADLDTTIVHNWQFYDSAERKWMSRDELSFNISGGSSDGYRGYSVKRTVEPGKWRVDVETTRGQVLGRVPFQIKYVDELPPLKEVIK